MASQTDQSNSVPDSHSVNFQSAYALYRYNEERDDTSTESSSTKADQNSFTLSLVSSTLNTVKETELRLYMCKRLPKCSLSGRKSHIGSVDINLSTENDGEDGGNVLCYYSLHERNKMSVSLDSGQSDSSSHYVVCLLSSQDALLDLAELDAFSGELVRRLDDDDPENVEEKAASRLGNWYQQCTSYLSQCVDRLGNSIKYLLYSALSDIPVQVEGVDSEFEGLIQKFVDCCSVSDLLQKTSSSEGSRKDSDSDLSAVLVNVASPADSVKLTSNKPDKLLLHWENDQWTFSSRDCSRFCEDWAEALVEGQALKPVVYLRQVIDNYKLKAIHDLNHLKRLLRDAQSNYYSLYRCLVFLRNCGNAVILLRQAHQEDSVRELDDNISILKLLEECLNKPLLPSR